MLSYGLTGRAGGDSTRSTLTGRMKKVLTFLIFVFFSEISTLTIVILKVVGPNRRAGIDNRRTGA